MTKLLEEAINKLSHLPENEQDEFAGIIFAELESEEKWGRLFADSRKELSRLGKHAVREHREGKTLSIALSHLSLDSQKFRIPSLRFLMLYAVEKLRAFS
jgi:hypothetical protein